LPDLGPATAGWFSRSISFPFIINGSWRRSKDRRQFLRLLEAKLAGQYLPLEQQQARQLERLRQLLVYAGQHVPYYRELFASTGFRPGALRALAELAALPPLTRFIVQEQAERLLSDEASQRGLRRSLSGGSTGVPVKIWNDSEYRDHEEAGQWLSDMAAGRRMGSRTAYLWGPRRDLGNPDTLQVRAVNWLRNQQWFNVYEASEARLLEFHQALQRHPPAILAAYASSVTLLASVLEAHGLKPNYPTVGLIPTAEATDETMRAMLARTFPAPVFDRYGSTELGLIAYECDQHHGLHLNLADNYVERLGPNADDEPGELLITQLNNYSMPLIRYEINDLALMARQDGVCACGRTAPLIGQVVGRKGVTFVSSFGTLIHAYYFTSRVRKVPAVREFQVIQESLRELRVRVVPGPGYAPQGFDPLREEVRRVLGPESALTVELVAQIARGPSGKAPMMLSNVRLPPGA
jgi:phenylacetate-CoA ligase